MKKKIRSFKQATTEAINLILYNDCMNFYMDTMRKSMQNLKSTLAEDELEEIHQQAKEMTIEKV